ncbi:sugar ABC transporter permease [candidate division KSB3 bacterium]|uniref:Sugar ABC transporter permease n=1 Tax=candidate division KSB3 bacterium TaxID=2044937 RepID=A0A9D5JVQ9_9BACT|nr:sugar ABC transporter permease [candidate division KSB3 bacterium]MBD3324802.1 sugar ABC transporter permease [candidate division KSB3 bacterium]
MGASIRAWRMRWIDNSQYFPMMLLVPVLIFFLVWNIIPLLWMVGMSFYNYSLVTGNPPKFIGFDNFIDLFNNFTVWGGLSTTFIFVLFSVGIETVLGMILGLLFWGSTSLPGRRLALTLLFSPMILTPAATGTFFRLIYEPTFGVANYLTKSLLGAEINFLGDEVWAMPAVLLVDIWMWTPFMILITLAALGSVPKAELEAAEVDRLPWPKRIWYVVFPHAKFILMLGILLRTIDSFKVMDLVYQLTRGGPGNTTEAIGLTLFRKAFEGFTMGWSAALAVITLLIAIAFTSIYLYILNLRAQRGEG